MNVRYKHSYNLNSIEMRVQNARSVKNYESTNRRTFAKS